jgi:sugar lactone lactonase YvrE
VAVAPDGTIIVSDGGALKVFRKDGMFLKKIDHLKAAAGELPAGGFLAANAKTGAIYVIASAGGKRYLLRLASVDDPTVTAEILLSPRSRQLAVDSEAGIVWVMRGHADDGLLRVKDLESRFEAKAFPARKKGGLVFPNFLAVAPDGRLYVVNRGYGAVIHTDTQGRYAGQIRAGAAGSSMATGSIATDRHGNLYVAQQWKWGAPEQIEKYSPAGKKLPIGDKAHLTLEDVQFVKGLWIAPNDDIYVAVTAPLPAGEVGRKMMQDIGNKPYAAEHLLGRVDVYSPDGALKQRGLVKLQGPNGLALGRDGSVYTVETYLHHGAHKQRLFKRKYKTSPEKYRYTLYDKLLKFPARGAQGGEKDALWAHPGIGGTSPWTCGAECCAAQVTVDADDRIWCHDGASYSVKALDAAGNLVLRVGTYGSEDCLGGGGDATWPGTSIVRDPEVPLARPSGVAVSNDVLFIADQFAGRVVRCTLRYAHSKKVAVKID